MPVAKFGRTSATTRDILSAAREVTNMATIQVWKGGPFDNPNYVLTVDEWVAYRPRGGDPEFCEVGGSGS